jgi:5-methylcytosine-specific restriction endonuclease McrA
LIVSCNVFELCCRSNCSTSKRKPLADDHVDPLKDGGPGGVANLQPLCGRCNSSKGASFVDYRPLADHVRMMEVMFERGILRRL